MCGIAGIIAKNAKNYEEHLNRMVKALNHRGPDGYGTCYFKNAALGHTRLSIIDIEGGNQPMLSAVSDCAITFNGEIYGYKEIRKGYSDYPFKTKCDTEVLLALYDKHGSDMIPHLPGMFSFAIWDNSTERLFCARDRFGEKPFYYAFGADGEFIFASEIKAILVTDLIEPVLDINAIGHYLKFAHLHPNMTCYQNIYTLPPAHQLTLENDNCRVIRYWELPAINNKISYAGALEQFEELLRKSVAKQLIADVPVGAFLSGGLDSSSVVITATNFIPEVQTYSFGFSNMISELPYAREVAKMYNTKHTELTDLRDDLAELFLRIPKIYDEPFADSSAIPTYLISKQARKYSKVILTGDGADELLAGYVWFYRHLFDYSQKIPRSDLAYLMEKLHFLLKKTLFKKTDRALKNRLLVYSATQKNTESLSHYHYRSKEHITNEKLLEAGLNINPEIIDKDFINYDTKTVDDALRHDIQAYLSGAILVKTDRASMANSLELRAPFLDVDLASFCISLPPNFKMDSYRDKLPLRENFEAQWPEKLRNRLKQGFGVPIPQWFQRDDFKELKKMYLYDNNRKIYQIMNYNNVQCAIRSDNQLTWSFLMLSVWLEQNNRVKFP